MPRHYSHNFNVDPCPFSLTSLKATLTPILHPSRGISRLLTAAVETGELLEIALDADIIPHDLGNRLLTKNRRSQRLLLGLLKARRSS